MKLHIIRAGSLFVPLLVLHLVAADRAGRAHDDEVHDLLTLVRSLLGRHVQLLDG